MGGDYRERTEMVARFRDEIAPVPGHARRDVHTLETKVAKQDFDAISRRQYFGRHGLTSVAKSATTRPLPACGGRLLRRSPDWSKLGSAENVHDESASPQ